MAIINQQKSRAPRTQRRLGQRQILSMFNRPRDTAAVNGRRTVPADLFFQPGVTELLAWAADSTPRSITDFLELRRDLDRLSLEAIGDAHLAHLVFERLLLVLDNRAERTAA